MPLLRRHRAEGSSPIRATLLSGIRKICTKLGFCGYMKKHHEISSRTDVPEVPEKATKIDHESNGRWGRLRDISDNAFVRLALKHHNQDQDADLPNSERQCTVVDKQEGYNNLVRIMKYSDGSKICIRVPACGWGNRWTKYDAILLRTTALTMQHIKRNTNLLLPEVVAYDCSFENEIGAPYLMMSVIEGRPVSEIWFEAEGPLPLEQKRQNILRSLAQTVSELHCLEFDKIGMLRFEEDEALTKLTFAMQSSDDIEKFLDSSQENIHIGASYQLNSGGDRSANFDQQEPEVIPAFDTSRAWLQAQLDDWKSTWSGLQDVEETTLWEYKGTFMLFSIILDYVPSPSCPDSEAKVDGHKRSETPLGEAVPKETFVIVPPDYDHQNIICDHYGNVTGIIDWDRVETVPRFLGWAVTPEFLNEDWTSAFYRWPHHKTLSPFELEAYRADYSKCMKEACEQRGVKTDDWQYTRNSHLYSAVYQALGSMQAMTQVLYKILDVVLPRVQKWEYVCSLGDEGWREGEEELIRNGLKELFA